MATLPTDHRFRSLATPHDYSDEEIVGSSNYFFTHARENFFKDLTEWIHTSPEKEKKNREEAVLRIQKVYKDKLPYLSLSALGLTTLPNSLIDIDFVDTIDLSKNAFTKLPFGLSDLTNLTSINLSFNKLAILDCVVSLWHKLKVLDLGHNFLSQVPESICSLSHLRFFNVSYNRLITLPSKLYHCKELCDLQANDNKLTDFPLSALFCENLQEINLVRNQIKSIPDCKNSSIATLKLAHNHLSELPKAILDYSKLNWLDVHSNPLQKFPDFPRPKNLYFFITESKDHFSPDWQRSCLDYKDPLL